MQHGFRLRPHETLDDFATLEDHQGGDALHTVRGSDVGGVIHVEFGHLDRVAALSRQLLKNRANRSTRAAPRGPKIDQRGHGGFQDFGLEIPFREFTQVGHEIHLLIP